ncbi:MAG: sigma-70 family RNA polymerase sigma factor [Saprospiraceae bacterium]|nr:sigma-70 family RNA polymerase sigma factor [Saprospiraceae bacterium]
MRQLKITQKITNRESQALEKYLADIAKIDTISPDKEVELAKRIKAGDDEALDELVRANLRFVVSVAKQYVNNGLSLNDLINEGNVGLLKAARRFDETRGFKFITFAVWWIRQSILSAIIENSRMIRLPYNKFHSQKQIVDLYQSFLQQNEREPSPEEISEIFGLKPEDVYLLIQSNNKHVSLDAPVGGDDGELSMLSLLGDESIHAPDLALLKDSIQIELRAGMKHLSPREREVLSRIYGLDGSSVMSYEELAEEMDISVERLRQIRELAVRRLRRYFLKFGIQPGVL